MQKMIGFALVVTCSLFLYAYNEPQTPKESPHGTINGLNPDILTNLADRLKKDPKSGQVTFYSNTKWQDGMRSVTSFAGYKVDGKMVHERDRRFALQGDEGVELGGTDSAPGAVEELMYATGTCIAAAANAKAATMGVKLTKLTVSLEGDINMHGLMGVDSNVRPGILDWRTKIVIGGKADDATLKEIALWGYNYSPVSDTVRHGVSKASAPEIIIEKS